MTINKQIVSYFLTLYKKNIFLKILQENRKKSYIFNKGNIYLLEKGVILPLNKFDSNFHTFV